MSPPIGVNGYGGYKFTREPIARITPKRDQLFAADCVLFASRQRLSYLSLDGTQWRALTLIKPC